MGTDLPGELQQWQQTWSLIWGATLWIIWIRRNAVVFRNEAWSIERLERALWDVVVDLARTAWTWIQWSVRHQPRAQPKNQRQFKRL